MSGRHTISDVTALSDAVDILAERFDNLDIMLTAIDKKVTRIELLQVEATKRHVEEMVEDSSMSKPYFDYQATRLRAHWWESFVTALGQKTLAVVGYGVLGGLLLLAGYMWARK